MPEGRLANGHQDTDGMYLLDGHSHCSLARCLNEADSIQKNLVDAQL